MTKRSKRSVPPQPHEAKSAVSKDSGSEIVAQLKGEYHQPNGDLVLHMLQELHYLVTSWQLEIAKLDKQIEQIHQAGPVVAGWLEPAAGEVDPLPASIDYQLCSLDENGTVAARDCPEPEMFGISKALARHRQLRELLDRKSVVENNIKHSLATLVNLRMDINV
jgi:hypothetical protein